MAAADIPAGFKTERVQATDHRRSRGRRYRGLYHGSGRNATAAPWVVRVLHYHLSELYPHKPRRIPVVGIFEKPQGIT